VDAVKWLQPKTALALLSLLLVLAIVFHESEEVSPGPLTAVHAAVPELSERGSCERCHGDSPAELSQACGECHEPIREQLVSRAGFHGAMEPGAASRCGRCHVEHHGAALAPVDARVFALAGVQDRADFRHDFVKFELVGAHAKLDCSACHRNADVEVLPSGAERFLGLSQRCDSCHKDPHEGRFAQSCAECHGQEKPFQSLDGFVHTESFPLRGVHSGHACSECHAKGTEHSVESVGGRGPRPEARRCQDCHASPHSESFATAVSALVSLQPQAVCIECHPLDRASFRVPEGALRRELHAASGFALDKPHAALRCEQCHVGYGTDRAFSERYPGRKAQDCAACHSDPHGGQFVTAGGTLQACVECHGSQTFSAHGFDLARHASTAFPLDGSHAKVRCDACHERVGDAPRRFRGTARDCAQCHADVHGDAFYSAVSGTARDCATCHESTDFAAERGFNAEVHAQRTGFELAGAHLRADCERCHVRSPQPDALGRRFGRVANVFGTPVDACATCHADAHAGAFDGAALAALDPKHDTCDRCHGVESFRELSRAFDHGAWTGFPLDGAHTSTDCDACHKVAFELPRDDRRVVSTRRLRAVTMLATGPLAQACTGCHSDAHEGHFDALPSVIDGKSGCARCHGTQSFTSHARDSFEHGAATGFSLDGAHARAACEACHVPRATPDARGRRFGRASGQRCSDCHTDPHVGQFAERDCTACHASAESWRALSFDHARDSRFALDVNHAKLACIACHKPSSLASGGTAVRYRPLGRTCVECHGFERGKR
jgi:hypothetical protein